MLAWLVATLRVANGPAAVQSAPAAAQCLSLLWMHGEDRRLPRIVIERFDRAYLLAEFKLKEN